MYPSLFCVAVYILRSGLRIYYLLAAVKPEISRQHVGYAAGKGKVDEVRRAEKLVYVSCNPKTLQRDVRYVGDTFEVASVTPYNMFPKTAELETLCVMKRKSL